MTVRFDWQYVEKTEMLLFILKLWRVEHLTDLSITNQTHTHTHVQYALLFGNILCAIEDLCHIFHANNSSDSNKIEVGSRIMRFENWFFRCSMWPSSLPSSWSKRRFDNTCWAEATDTHEMIGWSVSVDQRCHTSCHKRPKSINNFFNQLPTSIQLKSIEFNWQENKIKCWNKQTNKRSGSI